MVSLGLADFCFAPIDLPNSLFSCPEIGLDTIFPFYYKHLQTQAGRAPHLFLAAQKLHMRRLVFSWAGGKRRGSVHGYFNEALIDELAA